VGSDVVGVVVGVEISRAMCGWRFRELGLLVSSASGSVVSTRWDIRIRTLTVSSSYITAALAAVLSPQWFRVFDWGGYVVFLGMDHGTFGFAR